MSPFDFDKLIENHLARESKPKEAGRYYPSEIGGCMRKVWYSYKQPKPTQIDLIKIFEVGNIMHHFVAEVMRSEKNQHVQLLESELPFKIQMEGFLVSGRIDDLLLLKEDGKKLLVEVKSTGNLSFSEGPESSHMMQLQLYMHVLKEHNGLLLYIEKNTLRTKSYDIPYDEQLAAIALQRFVTLHKHITENKTPEPEARVSRKEEIGWQCRRCEWREECWKETPDSELKKISGQLKLI